MIVPQTKVAIITVTYNSADFIDPYLQSLAAFIRGTEHRLVLVDNNSQDATCAKIRQFIQDQGLTDNIHLIPSPDNVGFGQGCNQGVDFAQAFNPTHLWFLNPDTCINEDTGTTLLHFLQATPAVQFAGSVLLNQAGEAHAGAFRFPTLLNVLLSGLKLGFLDRLLPQYTTAIPIQAQPYPADWLTGASFMVEAQAFQQLGGFDPTFFLYFEEVDLFFRARQRGMQAWACPSSRVFHISGASTGINHNKKETQRRPTYWFASRRHFYLSHFGRFYFIAIDMVFLASHLCWRLRAKLQRKEDKTPPHFVRDILRHSGLSR